MTVDQAAKLIKRGEIVAFPTETVYGLGADAKNPEAISKIYSLKGRPSDNPLIVHLSELWLSRQKLFMVLVLMQKIRKPSAKFIRLRDVHLIIR